MALGSVTGLLVFGKKSTVKDNCVAGSCTDAGLSAGNSGKNLATISDVGFAVGIVGLAVGTILRLTSGTEAPSAAHAQSPSLQPVFTFGGGVVSTGVS